jgi:hypothetical protein
MRCSRAAGHQRLLRAWKRPSTDPRDSPVNIGRPEAPIGRQRVSVGVGLTRKAHAPKRRCTTSKEMTL